MVCIASYFLLAACIGYITPVAESADIQKIVTDIGKGKLNDEVGNLLRDMQRKSNVSITKTGQYILATPLIISNDNKLTIGSKVGYYKNRSKQDVFGKNGGDCDKEDCDKEDCDKECQDGIKGISTKNCRSCVREENINIHTELLFVYGKRFRKELQESGIFLIYSTYIPCCGLAGYSYGECAGDMANYLFDRRNRPKRVYFVFIASGCFNGTNSELSMLYQSLAGIPLLQCKNIHNHEPIACTVNNSRHVSDITEYIAKPVFQRFPRIHPKKIRNEYSYQTYNKANIFCDCLAQGRFLQNHYNSENVSAVEGDPKTDLILSRFVVELFMSIHKGNVRNYEPDMLHIATKLPMSDNTGFIEQRCELFMKCLPDKILDRALKRNKKLNTKDNKYNLERDICQSAFGLRFNPLGKSNLCKDHRVDRG